MRTKTYSERINEQWLKLLKEAIDEGVRIQVNHRFKYKGKGLGTYLVGVKRSKKRDLIKKIKEIGVDFTFHSKKPKDVALKFIRDLREDPNPRKGGYITRFNMYILPKKDILPKSTQKEIERVWKQRFGEERPWRKRDDVPTRISKWKKFRYNRKVNPKGKWFQPKSKMGELYYWVYARKNKPWLMKRILDQFDATELQELKEEGFIKDSWLEKVK